MYIGIKGKHGDIKVINVIKIVCCIVLSIISLGIYGCGISYNGGEVDEIMELNKKSVKIAKGATATLTSNVSIENWSSESENVAKVENGIITAQGIGETVITATYKGQIKSCNVKVGGNMLVIGDSIFTTEFSSSMVEYIAESTGYTLFRDTIAGRTVAPASSVGIVDHIDSGFYDGLINDAEIDLIIIQVGTNDAYWSSQVGNGLRRGDANSTNKATTYGAMRYTIDYFKNKYPSARFIWSNAIYRSDVDSDVMSELNINFSAICFEKRIELFDLYSTTGINGVNTSSLTKDGIHPNLLGQEIYKTAFIEYLCTNEADFNKDAMLKISKTYKHASVNSSFSLSVTAISKNIVVIYSTNSDIIVYNNDEVRCLKKGAALIVVKADGLIRICTVEVE